MSNTVFRYEDWKNACTFLKAQIEQIDKNKHFNSLELQYFKLLNVDYKEYIKTEEFYEEYIDNLLFYGMEDQNFNHIYYIPKDRYSFRKKSFNSIVVRLINNAIAIYIYNLSKNFVNDIIDNSKSHIYSKYGGKIAYNSNEISVKRENLWYKNEYKNFTKEILKYVKETQNRIIIKLDIQDFYDTLNVEKFLMELYDCIKYSDKKDYEFDINKIKEIVDFYKFIMKGNVGFPQSDNDVMTSFMASLYMKIIDLDIISCLKKVNIKKLVDYNIVQYCDDTYLVLDFQDELKTEYLQEKINQLVQAICLNIRNKYNLKFNNKSKIFDIRKNEDIILLRKSIKLNSQTEIDLQQGERPQKVFNDIVNSLEKINDLSLIDVDELECISDLKKIYNDSVKEIFKKKENIEIISDILDKINLKKIYLIAKYIVTIISYIPN